MKHLLALAAALVLSQVAPSPASAATFKRISKMTSVQASDLAKTVSRKIKNEGAFGDIKVVAAYSFTRKPTEQDLNTVKQLNFAKGYLNSDDAGATARDQDSEEIARLFLGENLEPDYEDIYNDAVEDISIAIDAVKAKRSLKIFGANHADEDGTWQILNVLDTRNKEILFLRVGGSGT